MRSAGKYRQHPRGPVLVVPARRVGNVLHVACTACRTVHVQPLASRVTRCYASGSLAHRFGRVFSVACCNSTAELLQLADQCWLFFGGWELAPDDKHWTHSVLGGAFDAPSALALQRDLDAVHARRLLRPIEARC